MSKFVKIDVSTKISTEFYIEVADEATDEQIRVQAEKEITALPHQYPTLIDAYLKRNFNLTVHGIDSMLRDWIADELNFLIDGRSCQLIEGK